MKKVLLLLVLVFLVSGALFAELRSGSNAWVASKSIPLKSSTWFFATTRGQLVLGDQVTVLQISGNWAEVRSSKNSSLSGWTQKTNLSERQIVASGATASSGEVALAGKGFSKEVEDSYKTRGEYNYDDVDKVEANTVSQDDLYKFMVDGRLVTGE